MSYSQIRRCGLLLVAALLVLSLAPGLAAAQNGVGGSIVVEEGETVSEINAVSGTILIHGTVTGDVNGAAGNVVITGTVEGDVDVATGNLQIAGDVGGDVSTGAGNVHLEEDATVGGNFDVGADNARIDGAIDGDARIGAQTIHLGENASIGGSLTYDGQLEGNRDAVAGDITRDRTLGPTSLTEFQPLNSWVVALYAFVANLLLGAALLALFPRFSGRVAERVGTDPLRTGLVGLGVLVGVPLLLVAIALTIIGIPITLAGFLLFLFVAWVGLVYGRFALGVWLLGLVTGDRDATSTGDESGEGETSASRWIALLVGLAIGGALTLIPVVGDLLNLLVFLLGLGAFTVVLYNRRGRSGGASDEAQPAESSTR